MNLVSLFVQVPGLCVISAHQLETQTYDQSFHGVRVVMVVRLRTAGEVRFTECLNTAGGQLDEWQLRFVGMTHDGTEQRRDKWKGNLFVRHGGPELVGWWIQEREWKAFFPLESGLPETVYAFWDILVYCRKYDSDMDELHDAYLEYIGGQTKVYCLLHRTPMIPSVKVRGLCNKCSVLGEDGV